MVKPQRIACLHMNQLGDLLFSLPSLYNLRKHFPDACITSIVRQPLSSLLELSGLVDGIAQRPRGSIVSTLRFARELRRERFDLAVLFSTSFFVWLIAQISGARKKVGFMHAVYGIGMSPRVQWLPPPSTQNNLRLMEAIGCPVLKKDYVGLIRPDPAEQETAHQILESVGIHDNDGFVVLAPGTSGGREIKRWSDRGFADVSDLLLAEFGLKSVVVGLGGGELICNLSRNAVDLTGKTPLPVLAAVLERAVVFVGVDSGVMHLAAAVGIPVVGLFGPSDPQVTGPQGEDHRVVCADMPCRPCLAKTCDLGRRCMIGITPEMVFEAAASVISDQ